MDYKDSLNLPRTDFPMKANLPQREPIFLKRWDQINLYGLIRKKSKDKPKYILHDGPPYANGDIHIGHALNKTLKDIVIRFKTMQGYDSNFIPGWDCHGLPVEHQLFKELGISKYQISQLEFRKKAYSYAMKFVNIQKEQFKRLGVIGDWDNPYLTLNSQYEEVIVNSFKELFKKGYIYRGLKPVNWCYICETALAEAEVEYEERTSPSIYVKFKLSDAKDYPLDTFLVIWTTTPWTLIANVAVAVHPEFIYVLIKTEKGNLILAKELSDSVLSKAGIKKYEVIKEFKGKELEGLFYLHPFGLRKGIVVLADYVSKEEGTGLVHTAPGHGNEDYLTGIKYKLEIIMPVDSKGKFDSTAGEFKGLNVDEANNLIIDKLLKIQALIFAETIRHSYPHCWRCKTPVIFRATEQWFMNVDHAQLRKKTLEAIKKDIRWIPASGKERISSMVELRPDWCLSRQRYWGVPIPALICKRCSKEFLDKRVIEKFVSFVAKETSDCWFSRDIKDFLPENLTCPYCKGKGFLKGNDILDVWFDSGVSHQAVLKRKEELSFPCDLYLEGSDQHRGWFQSSILPSIAIDGIAPYRAVLTHGFVVDGEGRKMSKSLGNVISPQDIIKDYGADILRLWVASSDYNEDIRISDKILLRLTEAYRKIRNTARFILSNLYDFSPSNDRVDYDKLRKIDKWILFRAQRLLDYVTKAYEDFQFHKAYRAIYDFCNEELSMYYLDMIKGRLYTYPKTSLERRSAQTAIYEVLNIIVRLIAPILVFTAEEIWQDIPKPQQDQDSVISVHLADWPRIDSQFFQRDIPQEKNIEAELKVVIDLIPEIDKALENIRWQGIIGSSYDAQIILLTNEKNRYKYLESLKEELAEIFKVSQIKINLVSDLSYGIRSAVFSDIAIEAKKAEGLKCQRCWNYSLEVGSDKENPLICQRCLRALKQN
ncbi:MAG: isoleucine--tRNA ligase [Candidatus Omnitrophica bacterium]|nr:isoleucine--tRNA ligase [Candidatus Omnitrophota bacterium]